MPAAQRGHSLRALVLNLWARRGNWADRRRVLAKGLRESDPDLIAFVESIQTADYDQVADLIGRNFHVYHQAAREPDGQGMSIASRWPIDDVDELDLHVTPRTAGFACGAIIATIGAPPPFGSILFVTYVPNWQVNFEYEREQQAVAVARSTEERATGVDHVVLAGDLGDADSASVRFWTGRQSLDGMSVCYRDAWASRHPDGSGDTFTPRNPLVYDWDWPFRRVDLVLVRCGEHGGPTLEIVACDRVFDEPVDGVWASDHFGVIAELAPPTRDAAL